MAVVGSGACDGWHAGVVFESIEVTGDEEAGGCSRVNGGGGRCVGLWGNVLWEGGNRTFYEFDLIRC